MQIKQRLKVEENENMETEYNKMENTKNEQQCAIARLFNELNLKHNKGEGDILLLYQDNTIYVCEQDYDSLKILEEIHL